MLKCFWEFCPIEPRHQIIIKNMCITTLLIELKWVLKVNQFAIELTPLLSITFR